MYFTHGSLRSRGRALSWIFEGLVKPISYIPLRRSACLANDKFGVGMKMNKTNSPSSSNDFTLYKGELLSSCCCVSVTWKAIYQPSATRRG